MTRLSLLLLAAATSLLISPTAAQTTSTAQPTSAATSSPIPSSTTITSNSNPGTTSTLTCDPIWGCTTPSTIPSTTGTGTGTSTSTPTPPTCNTGIPGAFILTSPNITSILVVGSRYPITWTYAPTTSPTLPSRSISILLALVSSGGSDLPVTPETWYQTPAVAQDLGPRTTGFAWTVPQLQTGTYRIRVVGDDADPDLVRARGGTPCVLEGQPLPGESQRFLVVGDGQLQSYPDNFGPSNGARGWTGNGMAVGAAAAAAVAVMAGMV
ncbi:hypothetical protein HDU96_007944 [Phlyctochytrium bullatum]|nr:hypothetical protein HDU96_007944 [Phlyctochytrium bullatum]